MSSEGSTAVTSPSTLAAQRAHEPSMEEILASIRRIIADDQMLPLTRSGVAAAKVVETPPEPEMVETAVAARAETPDVEAVLEPEAAPVVVEEPSPAAPSAAPAPERKRPIFVATSPRPAAAVAEPAPVAALTSTETQPVAVADEPLMSQGAGESVSSAFGALATSMFLQNTGMVEEALREMLRPLLKQWLDDNLPVMVERLVRAEIERVARGGRR